MDKITEIRIEEIFDEENNQHYYWIYYYKNDGNLEFSNITENSGLNQPSFSHGASYVDLDNDGDLDLVVNNVNEQAYIYRNNSEMSENNFIRLKLKDNKPTFGTKVSLYKEDHFQYFETTNVRGIYSNSEDIVHFGLGQYNSVDSIVIEWPDQKIQTIYSPKTNKLHEIKKKAKTKTQKTSVETKDKK